MPKTNLFYLIFFIFCFSCNNSFYYESTYKIILPDSFLVKEEKILDWVSIVEINIQKDDCKEFINKNEFSKFHMNDDLDNVFDLFDVVDLLQNIDTFDINNSFMYKKLTTTQDNMIYCLLDSLNGTLICEYHYPDMAGHY